MAESGHKSISRIDTADKKMHGWYVRVWYKGKMHSKFFNDKFFNGTDDALKAAIEYRNELEEKIGKPRTNRVVVTNSPRNQTGVIGVNRVRKQTGAYVPYTAIPNYSDVYEVTWQEAPNTVRRTTISVAKYGEEEAFRRACAIRRQKEQQIYGHAIQEFPFSDEELEAVD
jgi:hypothetical protein